MRHITHSALPIIRKNCCIHYPMTAVALLIITFFLTIKNSAANEPTPDVLILNAYHQGEDWSDNQLKGIQFVFKKAYPFLVPSIEHMDTKRFPYPGHLLVEKKYLKNKYRDKHFDLIMTLDNSALNLMLKFGNELFPGVPVVFAGVNGYSADMLKGRRNITGVAEIEDVLGTLNLALTINPDIKTVFAVHDYTSSGFAVRRDMESVAEKFKGKVTVEYTPDETVDDLVSQLKVLHQDAIVIILTYVTDKSGRTFTREESTRIITSASPVPVYAMHETRLGYGILGGMLLEGVEHGKQAAEIALRILSGEKPGTIKVVNSRSLPVFDYNQLVRFKIPIKRLPADSAIIGKPLSFWTEHQPVLLPGSIILGLLTTTIFILIFSITRIRKAEGAVRKSEEKYRLIVQNQNDLVVKFDSNQRIVYASPSYCRTFGKSENDLLGSDFKPLIHPEDIPAVKASLATLTEEPHVTSHEERAKTVDGWKWFSWSAKAVFNNGKIEEVISVGRDVTERKKAENELLRSKQNIEEAQRIAHMGSWEWDLNTKKVVWSDELYRIYGRNKEQGPPSLENWQKHIHPDDVVLLENQIKESFVAGTYSTEYRLIRYDNGEERTVHAEGKVRYTDEGIPSKHFGIAIDITERKKAEKEKEMLEARIQQAQKMESIGSLAGGIAHDFNNMLFPIVGLAEILAEDLPPGSPERVNAQEILHAGKRAADLVNQILAFSRQQEHKLIPTRVQQVLKEVVNLSRSTIPTNIRINQDLQPECGLVLADSTQIHQIGMNLITNAYHAVEQIDGQISVQVKEVVLNEDSISTMSIQPGKYAILSVSDNGVGISPANLKKIFDPYFTTKGIGKGTGLGLAVVYGIVKEHKGDIKVHSEIGKGTTFEIFLPLMAAPEATESDIGQVPLEGGTERILLIDDEAPIARLSRQMLERLGYKISERTSSVDALEAFKTNPDAYDLVLTDMSMPNMTGEKLAREMLAVRPDMPIIICTGFSERMNEAHARAMGFKGYLMKPVVKAALATEVRRVLDEAKGKVQH